MNISVMTFNPAWNRFYCWIFVVRGHEFTQQKVQHDIKLLKIFVEVPHCWLDAAFMDMVLIVGKLPIKSTQVVPVKGCSLGCGLTPMKGHDLITLQL